MKTIRAAILAMAILALMLTAGCEHGWRADFTNSSPTGVDVYRNGNLQFTLAPNADGDCHLALDDDFAVLDHATGHERGSYHVEASGDVYDVRVTAIIFADHVAWSTDLSADDL